MEHVGGLLPDVASEKHLPPSGETAPTRECEHCGREITGEWVPFPPALSAKYGRDGQWWFPPCSSECQAADEQLEWEQQTRARKTAALLEKSEMPERLSRSTLARFDPSFSPAAARGLAAVRDYLAAWKEMRQEGRGLYLVGGVGCGKTHLAAGMARVLMEEHYVPTLFHTAPGLLDRLRPSEDSDREAWAAWAMNAELLVLDDLGVEKATEWAKERLFVLVNHRYRRSLPTVYTSNLGPGELGRHLGERTLSRIAETCRFVELAGPDHRFARRRSTGG
jgi:DNA replication protein DnaC